MVTRSNCLLWALSRWFRLGGYLVVRRSHYGWFPHFLWLAPSGELRSFVPVDPCFHWCPPLLFRGHVVTGDTAQEK